MTGAFLFGANLPLRSGNYDMPIMKATNIKRFADDNSHGEYERMNIPAPNIADEFRSREGWNATQ